MTNNSRVKIGGVDHVIGGWGRYESDRRSIERKISSDPSLGGGSYYRGRKYITSSDVVESILGDPHRMNPLKKVARDLSESLGRIEQKICDDYSGNGIWECPISDVDSSMIIVPSITSSDVNSIKWSDVDDLYEVNEAVNHLVQSMSILGKYDGEFMRPLPPKEYPPELGHALVADKKQLTTLEKGMRRYVSYMEDIQSRLANHMILATEALNIMGEKIGGNDTDWVHVCRGLSNGVHHMVDLGSPICMIMKSDDYLSLINPTTIAYASFCIDSGLCESIAMDCRDGIYMIDFGNHSRVVSPDSIHKWLSRLSSNDGTSNNGVSNVCIEDYAKYLSEIGIILTRLTSPSTHAKIRTWDHQEHKNLVSTMKNASVMDVVSACKKSMGLPWTDVSSGIIKYSDGELDLINTMWLYTSGYAAWGCIEGNELCIFRPSHSLISAYLRYPKETCDDILYSYEKMSGPIPLKLQNAGFLTIR